jgi:hypothetical protein
MGIEAELFASFMLGFVLNALPGAADSYQETIASLLENNLTMILLVVLVAPIFEELIFRFVILSLGQRFMPFMAANVLQAAIFGIYHMNLIQGIYAFVLGFVIGLFRKYTGSVIPCICFHVVFNITGLLADDYLPDDLNTVIGVTIMLVSLAAFILTFMTLRKNGHDRQTA